MSRLDQFGSYIEDAMQSWHCPGAAVVIVKGEEVLHQGAYGLQNVEDQLPMTLDTRFAMASVTKSFTAMSVALLVDEGKLEWDKPVREYMPEFILNDPYVTQHITVRDMLSHRTGLPRHDFAAWRIDLPLAEFIQRMRHFKFSATFREKFQYNNLMYYASAYLVEKVSGQRWEDFVKTRIFDPLGMTASNFAPESPQPDQQTAWGYRVDRDQEGSAKGLIRMAYGLHTALSPGAAGALFSTAADLLQWLKVHVNNGRAGDVQLISPNNLKQMHLPHSIIPGGGVSEAMTGNTIFNYGLGWFIEPYRGYTLVHHGGNVEGFSLIIGFVPQTGVGVVGLTNIAGLPLRDIILYEGVDRALDLPDSDWNTKYHALYDPMIIGQAKGKQTSAAERVDNALFTHPPETYVGTYAADGYPDFGVRRYKDGFQASTIGSIDWSELRHYHYNVFEWYLADFDSWMKVQFLVNDNGEIDSVSIPIEPAVANVIFKRKPLELPSDLIAALVGEYATTIEGMSFIVTAHNGKLYVGQKDSASEEAKVYKCDDQLVGLETKRTRFDFERDNGTFKRMLLKVPGMTLEATRKA